VCCRGWFCKISRWFPAPAPRPPTLLLITRLNAAAVRQVLSKGVNKLAISS
jgi:hypothetical protein